MTEEPSREKKRYECLEDLEISATIAKKLRDLGFHTVENLAMATAKELEQAGLNKKSSEKLIRKARLSMPFQFIRGDELVKMRENVLRLTTGSTMLDKLLGGGIESQSITEFYGEYGSGKSQICHQLCVNVQLPLEQGGLEGAALYIDTENTFRTERIFQMANNLGLEPIETIKNIIFAEAYTSDHQIFLLENADRIVKENGIRLIIVDSLTSHFRSEYLGREMLQERQQKLNKHMHMLIRLSRAFNAVAVVTNQVMSKPDVFFGEAIHPVGGHIVAHTSHTRVFLRKSARGPVRIARLVSSPHLPEGEGVFRITERGIEDINENEREG
ncbi:DNA repair and recombination protein RadA [Candidatus Bathyarchaeota archaeon]|nr:DNA repair and recombination protein RadA [Candidatus Bathyarchaeota archaeon]